MRDMHGCVADRGSRREAGGGDPGGLCCAGCRDGSGAAGEARDSADAAALGHDIRDGDRHGDPDGVLRWSEAGELLGWPRISDAGDSGGCRTRTMAWAEVDGAMRWSH